MNAKESYEYAKNTLKGRYEDFEKETLEGKWINHYGYVHSYVKNIIKGRWAELEKSYIDKIVIPKKPEEGFYCWPVTLCNHYCKEIVKGRWEEFENKLLDVHKYWPHNDYGIYYCNKIVKGRWEELEKITITDPIASVRYAIQVIKGRWREAEEIIKKSPMAAYEYAKCVVKGRWKEAEDIILSAKNDVEAYWYAKYVIQGRWKEAEDIIENGSLEKNYKKLITSKISELLNDKNYDAVLEYVDYKHFTNIIKNLEKKHHIPDVIKNAMIASCLTEKDQNSTQFIKQDKIFKEKMKSFLSDYKGLMVDEVINKL